MAQNIYDDPAFFEGYSQFTRSREGLAGASEWPSLKAMLPPLNGARVLDLGCGFGAFCRYAVEQGAADVLGIDISEKMLDDARGRGPGLPIRYERADLEAYEPPPGAFDLVFSSLAVHYLADFEAFVARVTRALKPGGRFVFSMEHPVFAARANPEFVKDADGHMVGAVDDYLREGKRLTNWIADGVVKYHRLISTTINTLQWSGLRLDQIEEWRATDADVAAHPEWAEQRYQPMFLLMATSLDPRLSANT
ncbi:MAG: SAM-dependent methyltransferase [Devosia sp.]|uniref:class I SAM-dependent methyltransferase n=1 Tax=Devosia sp. TaxID=1871048 RepID=UPI002633123A|nr:class I SAM-dependent methyltransferase [Devosia sp.]MDB5540014.1 SAM-dependent methyltransferase [Devosia sp.]